MNKPLHERLTALLDFLSPPCANSLSPPALELLAEAVKMLTPPPAGEIAPSAVPMPWPTLHAGTRLVTGAYTQAIVADYGNARAAERDAFWRSQAAVITPDVAKLVEEVKRLADNALNARGNAAGSAVKDTTNLWVGSNAAREALLAAIDRIASATQASASAQEGGEASQAARDVLAERQRQISAEGWTPEHDDEHDDGSLACAASVYANPEVWNIIGAGPCGWPWDVNSYRPTTRRRDLIKAGALIVAEIERLDRRVARGPICSDCGAREDAPHNYGCMHPNWTFDMNNDPATPTHQAAELVPSDWKLIAPDGVEFIGESPLQCARAAGKHHIKTDPEAAKRFMAVIEEARAEGQAEREQCMADYGTLDCPACGGSGHIADAKANEARTASTPGTLPAEVASEPHITEAMIEAYLTANDAYWRRTDEIPTKPGKWRTGSPSEATRVSLAAALAAQPLAGKDIS